jgi:hypothetical protein
MTSKHYSIHPSLYHASETSHHASMALDTVPMQIPAHLSVSSSAACSTALNEPTLQVQTPPERSPDPAPISVDSTTSPISKPFPSMASKPSCVTPEAARVHPQEDRPLRAAAIAAQVLLMWLPRVVERQVNVARLGKGQRPEAFGQLAGGGDQRGISGHVHGADSSGPPPPDQPFGPTRYQ